MSQFLIDLQEASRKSLKLNSDDPLHFSENSDGGSLSFARVIGSIGASIPASGTSSMPDGELADDEIWIDGSTSGAVELNNIGDA